MVETEESEVNLINKRNDIENEKLHNLLIRNTIYYIVVCVVVGLPIWFFTTTTYRAPLPFEEIDEIALLNRVDLRVKLEIIHFDAILNEEKLSELKVKLLQELNTSNKNNGLNIIFDVAISKPKEYILKQALDSSNLEEFDNKFKGPNLNILKVFVFDEFLSKKFGLSEADTVFLNSLFITKLQQSDLSILTELIRNDYLHYNTLWEIFRNKIDAERKLSSKRDLKTMNFDSDYEITFSLINSNPEAYKSNWNIESAIKNYFQKLIDQLSIYINFSLKAQTLLYSEFDNHAISSTSDKSFYYVKPSDLSIMTNNIESRLGSRVSDSTALEFVTYIPPKQPLYLVSNVQNAEATRTSAFLISRWGGIYIYNQSPNTNNGSINLNEAMNIYTTQFLEIIGINLNNNGKRFVRNGLYSSELYAYLLAKTLENQLNSINTLKSVALLLTRISSMVIEDDIAAQFILSLESIKKCITSLKEGNVEQAFMSSKKAFVSSEKAFFDPSLLEKLYFPEDQRFAIYIPLFIPVAIPIFLSLKSIVQYFKKHKNQSKVQ